MKEDIYKKIDEERIRQALKHGQWNDALILFKYSALTKDEFIEIQENMEDNQLLEFLKEKDKERIEQAFSARQEEAANFIFKTSKLTFREFNEVKSRFEKSNNIEDMQSVNRTDNNWEKILRVIKTQISSPSFETWFNHTSGEIRDNQLIVYCENLFQKDWLEERYKKLIFWGADEVGAKVESIQFVPLDSSNLHQGGKERL